MITICIACYNEAENLPRLLTSLQEHDINRVIAVSGAIIGYPGATSPYSTDGTIEKLEQFGVDVIQSKLYYANQASLRNEYIKKLKDGEQFLVLDADEELEFVTDFEGISANAKICFPNDNESVLSPRLITYTEGMQYATHWLIYKNAKPYLDLSFVRGTRQTPLEHPKFPDMPYSALINNYRKHNPQWAGFKEKHRAQEYATINML